MLIPDSFAQANVRFTGGALPFGAECTFGFTVAEFEGTPADAATTIGDLWADTFGPQQTAMVGVSSVLVKFGPNDTGPSAEVAGPGSAGVGTSVVPPNWSVLISKQTASGGRKNKGRMFVPGLAEGSVDNAGVINSAVLPDWQAACDAFFDGMVAADMTLVLLHNHPDDTPTFLTGLQVQSTGATQRRRMRR